MNKNQSTLKSRMKYFESLIGDVPVNVDTTDNFLKPSKRKKTRRINMGKSDESNRTNVVLDQKQRWPRSGLNYHWQVYHLTVHLLKLKKASCHNFFPSSKDQKYLMNITLFLKVNYISIEDR